LAVNYWGLHSAAGLAAENPTAGGGLGEVQDPTPWLRVSTWIATFGLLTLIAVVIGRGKLGRNSGLLIDHRRRMSLSRTQMVIWTLIILSGFTTAVFVNLAAGSLEPMPISIPKELWAHHLADRFASDKGHERESNRQRG
jgi:hypothetical protein